MLDLLDLLSVCLCVCLGLLDQALISLGLALSPPSTSVSLDFMVLCKCLKNYTYFTLPCRGLGLVGLALYLVDVKPYSTTTVCLCDCPYNRTKTAETTIAKLATGIVYHESWLAI